MSNESAVPPPVPAYPPGVFDQFNPNTTLWNPGNARALAHAAKLAYEDSGDVVESAAVSWGFRADRVSVISSSASVLQAIVLGSDTAVVLAFRGTRSQDMADWMTDFEISQSPFTAYFSASNIGEVHDGFASLLAKNWKAVLGAVLGCQDNGHGQLRFFDGDGELHSDDHWWNSFLISFDVGFENMGRLLAAPVEDHLLKNYIANVEKYPADLAADKQQSL
jgi:hypothetical protein